MNRFRHDRTWAILFTGEELDRHDAMIKADERAKVFDEIIGLLKAKAWDEDENTWLFFNSVLVPISMVISEIEQLKEKKE